MKAKLSVANLYKVFGDQPEQAFPLLEQGIDKDEVFRQTGLTIAVKDASFDIHAGEIFVIMGLSGSGKSTLVRLLNRLIEPTRGHVYLDGEDIASMDNASLRRARRKKISMVFQSFALMPHLNIQDNVAFGLELDGMSRDERHQRARQALERVGLSAHEHSYPDQLSGGMQQRVGLARALAVDPDVLLMDEAFSALDPLIRTEMQDELIQLQARDKRTIVFISHDLDEAMRIGDRIAIMQDGVVVQIGTPDEILHNPANDYVRSFFRGVDVARVFTAKDVASRRQVTLIQKGEGGIRIALQRMRDQDRDYAYVLDRERRYLGTVSIDSLARAEKDGASMNTAMLQQVQPVEAKTPLGELLGTVAQTPCGVPVVNEQGIYLGVITKAALLETLDREGETSV
ncbi:glycine betaine/L-proline ABC transporter ATP-binding protein ProV [Oceanisphaera psychrotolerans]|uniref:Quaternary amine transport ATP-binding protein n=1 Tax=Oceanisphaera psychrotolerans TaxID=1414654 RepID=A0A1J4QDE7_9GAMM|nr:glycine betaine/L-proline ABC transporter ATP-binding protein ProV [Oceanisphaera psychrotolerans]OIN05535.1 glycine betaine/L-proline ABC transporter ATP-binding protein [Oceanisphaera psychrotolerans]